MRYPDRPIRDYFTSLIWLCLLLVICFVFGIMIQVGLRWQNMMPLAEPEVVSLTLPTLIATNTRPSIKATATSQPSSTETSPPIPSKTTTLIPSPSPFATKTPQPSPTIVIEYTVQAGDTLSQIAAQFNVSVNDLLDANPEQGIGLLSVDDVLIIPSSAIQFFNGFKMEEYTVKPGDTLFQIARQFDLSIEALQRANPNIKSETINIGDILLIPIIKTPIAEEFYAPTNHEFQSYIVQQGDTLFGIAMQFGVSFEDIQAANPDLDPNRLKIGNQILIPESSENKE